MRKKLFPWIIALSALSVSGSAAFYSVYGLGKMFAGATLEVMILAGSLEFAKLVTASLLYQYWKALNKVLKVYLLIATLVLIGVTSAGIYGFLSSAYQETAFKLENQGQVVSLLDQEKTVVEGELRTYQSQLEQKNNRVTQLTTVRTGLQTSQDALINQNRSTSSIRQQIKDVEAEIKRIDEEVQVINDSISSKNRKISSIELEKLEISSNEDIAKEIGPLKYIAGLTGKPVDVVVNWYILVLMLVFDPLAIALVIAANFAFEKAKEEKEIVEKKLKEEPQTFNQGPEKNAVTEEESTLIKDSDYPGEIFEPVTEENPLEETHEAEKKEKIAKVEEHKEKKTKRIVFESGEIKKIEIEEPNRKEEIVEVPKEFNPVNNIKESQKETQQPVDKYTRYIMENTPGFKGFKHNSGKNF
jgi:hypothetical protein